MILIQDGLMLNCLAIHDLVDRISESDNVYAVKGILICEQRRCLIISIVIRIQFQCF